MSGAAAGGGVDSDERGCLGESSVSLLLAMMCTRPAHGGAVVFSTFCLFAVQYTGNKLNQK